LRCNRGRINIPGEMTSACDAIRISLHTGSARSSCKRWRYALEMTQSLYWFRLTQSRHASRSDSSCGPVSAHGSSSDVLSHDPVIVKCREGWPAFQGR
jgi:hypothetical protein